MFSPTLLLALLAIAQTSIQEQLIPGAYLGDTPYKGLPFDSPSIISALRIQRDLALNVPINEWLWPAINLSTAYFGNDYSQERIQDIEQVLIMGYRRLVLDIYWDATNNVWQFCPVPLSKALLLRNPSPSPHKRDDIRIGAYTCSTSYRFRDFLIDLNRYLTSTELAANSEIANLVFLILNLHQHDTASLTTITEGLSDTIRSVFFHTTKDIDRIYTPQDFRQYRGNTSWPSWGQLVGHGAQLLVGFGDISLPVRTYYNISEDRALIFDAKELNGGKTMNVLHVTNGTTCRPDESAPSWGFLSDQNVRFSYDAALDVVCDENSADV
ncbi:hypothetical protein EC973_008918 [Apophysomyces ossiformis]|uniref:Maintenance of telomere capping protein 6 n=1 Tax=Apophysomyces ossiformis TaxID=679940 RepID=A0A8H7BRY1_9FUNG|nr:hypothetical protein EC973_008918 [Apophysomyces ossiformis]